MKTANLFMTTLIAIGLITVAAPGVSANYGQYGQYGQKGAQPGQNILVDKKVSKPGTVNQKGVESSTYVDNMSLNDTRYAPGDQVIFKIEVKNTSKETMTNIQVTDTFPAYVEPMVGPGNWNKDTRTLTYTIAELKSGATDVKYITARIYPQNQLPADQGIVKFVNNVEVRVNKMSDKDAAQFYAEKEILGITEVPKTGPELGLALLGLQALGLAVGLRMRKSK